VIWFDASAIPELAYGPWERAAAEELAGGVHQQPNVLVIAWVKRDPLRLKERGSAHPVHRLEQLHRLVANRRAARVDRHRLG
jgi:hypothetical protein